MKIEPRNYRHMLSDWDYLQINYPDLARGDMDYDYQNLEDFIRRPNRKTAVDVVISLIERWFEEYSIQLPYHAETDPRVRKIAKRWNMEVDIE